MFCLLFDGRRGLQVVCCVACVSLCLTLAVCGFSCVLAVVPCLVFDAYWLRFGVRCLLCVACCS